MARKGLDNDLSDIRDAVMDAIEEYAEIVWKTANDIYRSCIEDYYASYKPTVYKRHGFKEGKNLYQANGFTLNGMSFDDLEASEINIETLFQSSGELILDDFNGGNPEALWRYKTKEDIRAEVLKNVLSGQRGRKRRKPRATITNPEPEEWPRPWITSYPNKYSQYNYWNSAENTIQGIIDDFEANVFDDTEDLLYRIIDKQFK